MTCKLKCPLKVDNCCVVFINNENSISLNRKRFIVVKFGDDSCRYYNQQGAHAFWRNQNKTFIRP